jgi:hypothetical protein
MLYTRLKGGVSMRSLTLALLLVALIAIPALEARAEEKDWDDWKIGLGVYFPLTSISGDLSVASPMGGDAELPIDLSFRDITEYYKGSFNGILALKRRRWSFNLDFAYVKLEGEKYNPFILDSQVKVKTTLSITEGELFVGYQLSDPDQSVSEIIFGTRYISQKVNLVADLIVPAFSESDYGIDEELTESWWMGFLGARHYGPLLGAENWNLIVRADVGAFDTSGRLTWRANIGTNWQFANHFDLVLMYKWLGVDYKKGQPGDSDYYYYKAIEHGPIIGLGINF